MKSSRPPLAAPPASHVVYAEDSNVATSSPYSPEESHAYNTATVPDSSHNGRNSVNFLLNFSAESEFLDEFPPQPNMTPEAKLANFRSLMAILDGLTPVVGEFASKVPPGYRTYGILDTEKNLDDILRSLNFDSPDGILREEGGEPFPFMPSETVMSGQELLERRALMIRESLRHSVMVMSMPQEPPDEVVQAIEVITAYNLILYTQLYFHHWHKNTPMVHHATFNLVTAATPLVLAIIALGGMVQKLAPRLVDKAKADL